MGARQATAPSSGTGKMERETYKGYDLWGHAIAQQAELLTPERYAGGGTIVQGNKLICTSGVLDLFDSEEEAQGAGLAWARAWVDTHG